MDIAGISAAGLFESATSAQSLALKQSSAPPPAQTDTSEGAGSDAGRERGRGRPRGLALGALRQEIRAILREQFSLRSIVERYGSAAEPSVEQTVGDALAGAGALANDSPLTAGDELRQLREELAGRSDSLRALAEDDGALNDLDQAIARIDSGLATAQDDAARNVESSASVLSAESTLSQRSTIRVRTQEGDLVRLDLRRRESLVASDVSVQSENGAFSSTEVEVSSRSRLVFSVRGDLNDAELEAIRNVFSQAETVADDFFGGDLQAAFEASSALSFDTEQLSAVSLKFRERLSTEVAYGEVSVTRPVPEPKIQPAQEQLLPVPPQTDAQAPAPADETITPEATEVLAPQAPVDDEQDAPTAIDRGGLAAQLSNFLRQTLEGFSNGTGDQRFFFSNAFKLEVLKAVIEVAAPPGETETVEAALGEIDDAEEVAA